MPETSFEGLNTGLWIGGRWRNAADEGRFDVENPATEQVIASVASATVDDCISAVAAAQEAFAKWAATPPRVRGEILRKAYELMVRDGERLARIITMENGKSLADARGEVAYAAEFFRWNAEEAVRISGEFGLAPSGANRIVVDYQPIGICVLITPWNFPAAMATRKIAPALAAGCTVILKPASETPLTAYALAALYEEAGVPAGVVNVITTSNPGPVTAAMLADARVRKLSFTGSTGVGRALLAEAAKHVISCSMELGGNAPFIVLDDADLEAALDGAMIAKMRNAGEACTAANRLYVQAGIHDAFAEGLRKRMAALAIGPGTDPETECGPMITRKAVDKIDRLVQDAVARGAKVLCGGAIAEGRGFFYPPTVLSDVPADAAMAHEEIFGPVAPISRFEDEAEVIAKANDTEYGLAAYVCATRIDTIFQLVRRLDFAMVSVNGVKFTGAPIPFGGMKASGLGREGGAEGFEPFTETKYFCLGNLGLPVAATA